MVSREGSAAAPARVRFTAAAELRNLGKGGRPRACNTWFVSTSENCAESSKYKGFGAICLGSKIRLPEQKIKALEPASANPKTLECATRGSNPGHPD